jgi:hypothetical protein
MTSKEEKKPFEEMIPTFVEFIEGFAERLGISEGTESRGLNPNSTMAEMLASMGLDCGKQEDWDEFLKRFKNQFGYEAVGSPDLCAVSAGEWWENYV